MTTLLQFDATAQLALLASGTLSARELVTASVDLIDARDGELGAFTDSDRSAAIAAAASVDEARARGAGLPPLAGVPFSVKDPFDAAGLRASHGRLSDSRVSTRDAPVVRRLRDAGAIVVGKTNVPVFLDDHQASNPDFGVTRNPWDPRRSPGGSSGGSGAAVAAGMSSIDLGSDLAGSLRIPTAWCGLFGHKPSTGIVPKTSHMPWPEGGLLEPLVSAVGPMTRSARDLRLFLDQMIGADGPDARAWRLELPPPRVTGLAGLRVGLWLDDEYAHVDDETRAMISAFALALEGEGARIVPLQAPPGSGRAGDDLFVRLQAGEVVHGFADEDFARHEDLARTGAVFSVEVTQSLRTGLDALERQRSIAGAWDREVFDHVDVVLCPAAPIAAPTLSAHPAAEREIVIDDEVFGSDQIGAWSRLTLLPRCAATVVPLGPGPRSGLPIGAQLVSAYLEDLTAIQVAIDAEATGLIAYMPPPEWNRVPA